MSRQMRYNFHLVVYNTETPDQLTARLNALDTSGTGYAALIVKSVSSVPTVAEYTSTATLCFSRIDLSGHRTVENFVDRTTTRFFGNFPDDTLARHQHLSTMFSLVGDDLFQFQGVNLFDNSYRVVPTSDQQTKGGTRTVFNFDNTVNFVFNATSSNTGVSQTWLNQFFTQRIRNQVIFETNLTYSIPDIGATSVAPPSSAAFGDLTDVTDTSIAGDGQLVHRGVSDWVNIPEITVTPTAPRNINLTSTAGSILGNVGTSIILTANGGTASLISTVDNVVLTPGPDPSDVVEIGLNPSTYATRIPAIPYAIPNVQFVNNRISASNVTKATLGGDALTNTVTLGSTNAQDVTLVQNGVPVFEATPTTVVVGALGQKDLDLNGGSVDINAPFLSTHTYSAGLNVNSLGSVPVNFNFDTTDVASYLRTSITAGTPAGYASRIKDVVNGSASAVPNRQYVDTEVASRASAVHTHNGADITSGTIDVARLPTAIPATNISTGTVSNTEFDTLDGVTSSIQTQLNSKASTVHTHSAADITSGILAIARGGTNASSLASGTFLTAGATSVETTKLIPSGIVVGDTDTQILSNKSLVDATTSFTDDITPAKIVKFQLSNLTAGTKTFQFPNVASGTLVTDTTAVVNGGNSFGGGLMTVGANDANSFVLKSNNTNRLWMLSNQVEQNPFGTSLSYTNAIQLSSVGDGSTLLYGPYSNLGPVNNLTIQAPGGNGQAGGTLTLRAGGVFGGGVPGAINVETGNAVFNGGSSEGFIRLRTAHCSSLPSNISGAISLATGESGVNSGGISISTGGSGASTLGPSTGSISIFTGNTGLTTAATGSVGSINISCGSANTQTGVARNGGTVTVAASRGNQGGTNGAVNLYTELSSASGVQVASVDGGRRVVLDAGSITAATTRTYTCPDGTGTLALQSYVDARVGGNLFTQGTLVKSDGIMWDGTVWRNLQFPVGRISANSITATALLLSGSAAFATVANVTTVLDSNGFGFTNSANGQLQNTDTFTWMYSVTAVIRFDVATNNRMCQGRLAVVNAANTVTTVQTATDVVVTSGNTGRSVSMTIQDLVQLAPNERVVVQITNLDSADLVGIYGVTISATAQRLI